MKKPKTSRITTKHSVLILFVAVSLAAGVMIYRNLSGPAEGHVYYPGSEAISQPKTYIEQEGKHVVFNYPEDYQLKPAGKNSPNILETFSYQKTKPGRSGSLQLSISVYRSSGSLNEDGAYRLRKEQKEIYQERLTTINGQVFTIFKKDDGSETVAFTTNKDKTATIAISGTLANNNQSEAEFSELLNSWKWK